eukprot:TRINITY_DN25287_c0_g5_i1.p1 TRINITY_DN25287_c0_g5~~TRINITY_DN25287_c0_g5_i1.p1  ORF type:complete len:105 (-),score=13.40 TRINITY_DN25287_c0_g5_i1:156-470(-)
MAKNCHCQWGISGILLGFLIALAAAGFWVLGAIGDWNNITWWHVTNMVFFALGGFLFAFGCFYELVVKYWCTGNAPFAKEPFLQHEDLEGATVQPPSRYVMIVA